MASIRLTYLLFISLFWLVCAHAESVEEGHLELGAGPLVVVGNHYRGSDQGKIWIFPIPYFSYKSHKLEAEPSYVRGLLFHTRRFAFKLSLVPGLNVESKKNRARAGMPSLDYSLEAGPMAIFYLWKNKEKNLELTFEWPVREGFATDLSYIKPVGIITVPYLNFIYKPRKEDWTFDLEFSISPMFANKKYHDRLYSVPPEFETDVRKTYSAPGGYSGLQSAIVLNKRIKRYAILSFLRWDYLKGAAFEDSPLVKQKHYLLGGLGFFWIFD